MNEDAFRDLISGKKRGAIAGLCRTGLRGCSLLYGAAVRTRNQLFDTGLKRAHRAAVPVISVGNITTGGTGKTPFVAWLANWYRDKGVRVALLSRGYRALPGAVNDEKLVLDLLCPGIPHVQNADRVAGVETAVREHGAELIILDDGFQHRRLARDLDIVLVDALCPWGYGSLLPRGLLREPLSGLRRASVVALTRADQCDAREKQNLVTEIERIRSVPGVIEVCYAPVRLRNSAGETIEIATLRDQPLFAFCGIGNPEAFGKTLDQCGFQIANASFLIFPDHHHYSERDLSVIGERAARSNANAVLTTQKDLVKINCTKLNTVPLWAVEIGMKILTNASTLELRLESFISKH